MISFNNKWLFWIFLIALSFLTIVNCTNLSGGLGSQCVSSIDCEEYDLICSNQTCSNCRKTTECRETYGLNSVCKEVAKGNRRCLHKHILPIDYFDVIVSLCIFLAGALAAGGGIGGGGIFIPLLILVGGFEPEDAIPLSTVLIGGASVANYLQMCRRKIPGRNKELINYELTMLLQPLSLCGTVIGVILNTIFPNWLLLLLLTIVLFVTLIRTGMKGYRTWKQEQKLKSMNFNINSRNIQIDVEDANYDDPIIDTSVSQKKIIGITFTAMAMMLIITITLSLLRGRNEQKSIIGVYPCSILYWFFSFLSIPILLLIAIGICFYLVYLQKKRDSLGYAPQPGDLKWTPKITIIMTSISFVGGLLAGLLGIGGGMIFGPLMLEFKMLPEVVAATSSFMILFTSIAALVQFAISGRLLLGYSVWFAILGFLCSLVGQFLLDKIVKKYRKTSLIILCVFVVISISTVLLMTIGIMNIMEDIQAGASFGFQPLC